MRHIFTVHWRLIVLSAVLVAFFILLYALRDAIWPFALGLIIAYVLLPGMRWKERRLPGKRTSAKRLVLIVAVFIGFIALVGGLGFYIFTVVSGPFIELLDNASELIPQAFQQIEQLTREFRASLPPEIQQQVDQALQQLGSSLGEAARNIFLGGLTFIPSTFGFLAGLAALPFFLFYLLKDWEQLGQGFYGVLPPTAAQHTRSIAAIVERVIGRYVRAQIVLGASVGALVFLGLSILGIEFAPALALFAAITELIPIVGPWLGGAAGVLTALALQPEKALWVAIVYASVQLLENNVLVPRIHGGYLDIHPAVAIMLIVIGTYIAGFWGLLIAVPLGALLFQVYKYIVASAAAEDKNNVP